MASEAEIQAEFTNRNQILKERGMVQQEECKHQPAAARRGGRFYIDATEDIE